MPDILLSLSSPSKHWNAIKRILLIKHVINLMTLRFVYRLPLLSNRTPYGIMSSTFLRAILVASFSFTDWRHFPERLGKRVSKPAIRTEWLIKLIKISFIRKISTAKDTFKVLNF